MASSVMIRGRSKRTNVEGGRDIISNLPDEVLVYILSFLKTKDVFCTSVLSSRWGSLWTMVPNLVFHPKERHRKWIRDDSNDDPRYIDFIERMFLSHKSSVNKFQYHIKRTSRIDTSRLKAWVSYVVEHNVQDIDIDIFTDLDTEQQPEIDMQFPVSLFTCKTLATLKLNSFLEFDVPASISFPCLKVLHVSLRSPSNDLTQKLFCSSPVLEELRIVAFIYSDESVLNISSPSLRKVYVRIFEVVTCFGNSLPVVNVDAPVLEYFEVISAYSARFILKNSLALVKTHVSTGIAPYNDEALQNSFLVENMNLLLQSVSNVKDLSLGEHLPMAVFGSASEIKWPVFANMTRLGLELLNDFESRFSRCPPFPNLKHLHLTVDNDFASKNLSDLLMCAPNLVFLAFMKEIRSVKTEKFNHSEQKVPTCFRYCLREIEVDGLDGTESGLNLIKYLLMNTQVLEKMTIGVSNEIPYRRTKEFIKSMISITDGTILRRRIQWSIR